VLPLTFHTLVAVDTLPVIETTTVQVYMLFVHAQAHRRAGSLCVESDEGSMLLWQKTKNEDTGAKLINAFEVIRSLGKGVRLCSRARVHTHAARPEYLSVASVRWQCNR
jgi:hypothetical protein